MIIPEIGQEMKRFRKKHGYTQAQLAEILGVTKQSISNYETGKSQPNLSVIIHFSVASKLAVDDIVFYNKIKHFLGTPEALHIINEFRDKVSSAKPTSIRSKELDKITKDLYKKMDRSVF